MKKDRITLASSEDLIAFANRIAESAVAGSLREMGLFQEEEDGQVNATTSDPVNDGKPAGDGQPPPHDADNLEEPTVQMVVDKLNSIRSGHSFRDTSVKGAMEQYFEKLSDEEKIVLLTFLKAIAQIVTGEVPGSQAVEPDQTPQPGIKMSKVTPDGSPAGAKKVKNVSVIKSPKRSAASPSKGQENTQAPAPISPRSK